MGGAQQSLMGVAKPLSRKQPILCLSDGIANAKINWVATISAGASAELVVVPNKNNNRPEAIARRGGENKDREKDQDRSRPRAEL